MQPFFSKKHRTLTLTFTIAIALSIIGQGAIALTPRGASEHRQERTQGYYPLPDPSLPQREPQGVSRCGCSAHITPIIPNHDVLFGSQSHLSLYFYVSNFDPKPDSLLWNKGGGALHNYLDSMEFLLVPKSGHQEIFSIQLPGLDEEGLVHVTVDDVELEIWETYEWYFAAVCDPLDFGSASTVSGHLQLTAPSADLENQLGQATELEQTVIYASAGLWLEAVSLLQSLSMQSPDDPQIRDAWLDMLEVLEIENLGAAMRLEDQ